MDEQVSPQTTTESQVSEPTVTDASTGEQTVTSYAGGKFKSVSELEKGYSELQSSYSKKLGEFTGSPEQYTLSEGGEPNEVAQMIAEWGKDNQLSNDGYNQLVQKASEFMVAQEEAQAAEIQQQREAEIKLLGDNAKERISNVNDFLKANLGEDHGLDPATAKGIESIEKLINLSLKLEI